MYASLVDLADRSTRQLLKRLARLDVLLIAEWRWIPLLHQLEEDVALLGFQVKIPELVTILTTNLDYDEWHNFLGNKSMLEALLSRLRHYCHTVRIQGPSLRDPQG
jgi:DNA replication protein DnaC